jgi:hypothetical protein
VSSPNVQARRVAVGPRSASTTFKTLERPYRLTAKVAMVSGSGVCAKRIVVDACHHMLSRLSSIIAKELLNAQKVVIVHYEEICLSAGLVRQEVI